MWVEVWGGVVMLQVLWHGTQCVCVCAFMCTPCRRACQDALQVVVMRRRRRRRSGRLQEHQAACMPLSALVSCV